ncbi:uncharacterized protein LOC116207851 [Punica granatum]|uniref:Uncharacterized protein LOC116207851 n=1 Tax=Punica granatum TaxID=22663 RepID=A0A6P8DUB6_PUNGR|nr:uncharacterized protein LOC116207851 [Punica granatum]
MADSISALTNSTSGTINSSQPHSLPATVSTEIINPNQLLPLPATVPTIPVKLNGNNYFFWQGIMSALLETYDLLGYVEGDIPAPEKTISRDGIIVPNPAFRQWVMRDKFALTCIILALTEEIGCNIVGLKTSREAWTALETMFLAQTAAQIDFLEQQWRNLRKEGKTVLKYINSVRQLATRFAQIGKPKSSEQINRAIVTGLGLDLEPLVLALSPSLTAMTTNELTNLLLHNESRRLSASTVTQSVMALT